MIDEKLVQREHGTLGPRGRGGSGGWRGPQEVVAEQFSFGHDVDLLLPFLPGTQVQFSQRRIVSLSSSISSSSSGSIVPSSVQQASPIPTVRRKASQGASRVAKHSSCPSHTHTEPGRLEYRPSSRFPCCRRRPSGMYTHVFLCFPPLHVFFVFLRGPFAPSLSLSLSLSKSLCLACGPLLLVRLVGGLKLVSLQA